VLREELAVDVGHLAAEVFVEALAERQLEPPPARESLSSRFDPRPDERVGELGPGDADLDVLERDLGGLEARHERLQHPLAALDVACHGTCVVVAGREREAALDRNEPPGRLEAGHATAGRGDPDRPAGVGAERRVGQAGRERRGRAAARAAGDPSRRGGVRHRSEVRVLRGRAERELVQVGLADVCVAGRLQPPHRLGRLARHVVGEQDRAVGRDEPGRVEQVLDRERDPLAGRLRAGEEDALRRAQKTAR